MQAREPGIWKKNIADIYMYTGLIITLSDNHKGLNNQHADRPIEDWVPPVTMHQPCKLSTVLLQAILCFTVTVLKSLS